MADNQETHEVTPKTEKRKIISGVNLAWVYVVMSVISGMGQRNDGNFSKSYDSFIGAVIAVIGISLFLIRKKHNSNVYFFGSKLIESVLVGLLIIFLFISFTNPLGNWYESPLVWCVTPVWALVAYLILRFKKRS